MDDSNYRRVTDFSNLLMQLNQKIPTIGFNDEGKADAIFIETRELIKKHFGEEHAYYKDYLRVRKLKGSYTYQLNNLLPVVEVIANRANDDYQRDNENFQQQLLVDIEKAENIDRRIPWKQLDKLERRYELRESWSTKLQDLFQNCYWFLFDAHRLKVIFLLMLGLGLCSVPFFVNTIPDWLGYVSAVVVAIVGTLFTMNKKEK
jgi:hypothetical protein